MQGVNVKRILGTGPCCTSAPVSPLCRILDGRSMMFVCEREELSKKISVREIYIEINKIQLEQELSRIVSGREHTEPLA